MALTYFFPLKVSWTTNEEVDEENDCELDAIAADVASFESYSDEQYQEDFFTSSTLNRCDKSSCVIS